MIRVKHLVVALSFCLALLPFSSVQGQFAGSRGGVVHDATQTSVLPSLTPEVVQGYISVEGRAEIRVKPTQIRIVIAISADAETPQQCQTEIDQKVSAVKAGWQQLGINPTEIVDDFIAVLPRYEFELRKQETGNVAVEKEVGFLMQSNLHVAVKNDQQAMEAIRIAFANGVSDIIAFDYWNDQINEIKKQARTAAIESAKEKSDTLLAVFDNRPTLINIAEQTQTTYPESLYQSFDNSSDQQLYSSGRSFRDTTVIRAFRPRNTYYRGLYSDGDLMPRELPMKSEISVTSTVRLYYESPVASEYLKLRADVD